MTVGKINKIINPLRLTINANIDAVYENYLF